MLEFSEWDAILDFKNLLQNGGSQDFIGWVKNNPGFGLLWSSFFNYTNQHFGKRLNQEARGLDLNSLKVINGETAKTRELKLRKISGKREIDVLTLRKKPVTEVYLDPFLSHLVTRKRNRWRCWIALKPTMPAGILRISVAKKSLEI